MKFLLFLMISLFLILSLSKAQVVDINIKEIVKADTINIDYNSTLTDGRPFKVNMELFNSGSVGYNGRIRLDIFYGDDLVFTGWSHEKYFFPGNQEVYNLYWHPSDVEGKFKASIRIYHGNEIKKIKPIKFEIKPTEKTPEDIFEILDFRTYDEEVKLLIKTNKTFENVVIVPSDYPNDWIFEQTKIDKLESGNVKIISLRFQPSLWKEDDVTIHVFTEDGEYHTIRSFELKKETTFWKYYYKIIHDLRVLFKF